MVEKNIRFSVCIPALNEEKYICIILKALEQQTYKNFEVVIVDGGSKDKTEKVALQFKKVLNLRFYTSVGKGLSFDRNLAAKKAKEDHLVFFDADVRPESMFLEKLADAITRKKAVAATAWMTPISGRLIDKIMYLIVNITYFELPKHFAPGASGTFIYSSRKAFNEVKGFNEKAFIGEDTDLIRRIHKNGHKFIVLSNPRIDISVRRLDEEGRFNYVRKMLAVSLLQYFKGPVVDRADFDYHYGKHN